MHTWQILLFVGIFVIVDGTIVFVLVPAMVRETLGKIAAAHPAADIAPDAVRKNFQSLKVDLVNLGCCVHVAADDAYLHFRPALLGRLCGAKAASVPWEGVTPLKRARWSDAVTIAGLTVSGPKWALGLAFEE